MLYGALHNSNTYHSKRLCMKPNTLLLRPCVICELVKFFIIFFFRIDIYRHALLSHIHIFTLRNSDKIHNSYLFTFLKTTEGKSIWQRDIDFYRDMNLQYSPYWSGLGSTCIFKIISWSYRYHTIMIHILVEWIRKYSLQ